MLGTGHSILSPLLRVLEGWDYGVSQAALISRVWHLLPNSSVPKVPIYAMDVIRATLTSQRPMTPPLAFHNMSWLAGESGIPIC